ncbi:MAG: sulfatase [Planctomycetota bacterium]|nr:sulfatase [Planctomycetota bacterium]
MRSLPAPSIALAILVSAFAAGCGPSEIETLDVSQDPHRLGLNWGARDLLDGGAFRAGTSIETQRSRVVTRGTWEAKSSNGVKQTPVPDRGAFPMGTLLFGSGEEGKGFRNVKFPLPSDIRAQQLTVRVYATEGERLRMSVFAVGSGGPVAGEVVDFTPNGESTDVALRMPDVPGAVAAILEIAGDCTSPAFVSFTVSEVLEASTTLVRTRQGATGDKRWSLGLAPGAEIAAPVFFEGQGRLRASVLGHEGADGALELSWVEDGTPVATTRVEAGEGWREVSLEVPEASGAGELVVRNVGGSGVWIAEDRIDRRVAAAPTYLLITSDTHRGDHIGRYDAEERVLTPNLDRLADRGIVFTNCYAPTNVTNPSHMALMTGLPLRDTRIANNATALSMSANTLAENFQRAGFRTFAATSVRHLKPSQSGLHQGFDRYDAPLEGMRNGQVAVDRLLEWIPDAEGTPLFVWLHVYDAHAPYSPPANLVKSHYPSSKDPRAEDQDLGIDPKVLAPWITKRKITDPEYIDALYAAGVDYVDQIVGELLEVPRIDTGVVAFTADHGESLGVEGIWWAHSRLNYDTIHIPMMLSAAGLEPARTDAPVEQIDVGRTLLDIAGVDTEFPGRDLRWAVDEPEAAQPRFSLGAHGWSAAVEVDGWMLTLQIKEYPRPFSERTWVHGETELFNLREDPTAATNVLDENFERARAMREALTDWLSDPQGPGLAVDTELSPEALASLEALGYGGGTTGGAVGAWWAPRPGSDWNERFED